MAAFGSFCLLIGLALAAYNLIAGAVALRLIATGQPSRISPERLADTARRAGIAGFWAVTGAAFALVWSVFTNDFSITYILDHSNRALPIPYKFAALWSGQEGSLLLWAWLLGTYGFVLRLRHKTDVKLYAYAGTILAGIQVFFLLVLNFAAPPFALLKGAIPEDGNGLNPLLQYPEMVIHPPMLYLGYVGFSVPFAFALGALMMRYPGEKWIKITRVWTMVTWLFLTCGIFLGMHWAYAVLGWGGYWGWDPVENASFMPWLTGTAFLHSVMMQERKGMMKSWNVWLIFSTFLLTMLGTTADARRAGEFGSRLRAVVHRHMVHRLHGHRAGGVHLHLRTAARPPEDRASPGVAGEPRVELPVQQSGAADGLLCDSVGHAVSDHVGICGRQQSDGGRAVLQPRRRAHRAVSALSHRRGTAAAMARDIAQEPSAQFCAAGDCAVGYGDRLPGSGRAAVERRLV